MIFRNLVKLNVTSPMKSFWLFLYIEMYKFGNFIVHKHI